MCPTMCLSSESLRIGARWTDTGMCIPFLLAAYHIQWARGERYERRHGVRYGVLRSDNHNGMQHPLLCLLSFLTGGYHHLVLSFICTVHNIFHLHPEEYAGAFFKNLLPPLPEDQTEICIPQIYRLHHIYGRNLAVCIAPLVGSFGHLGSEPSNFWADCL